MSMCVPVRYLHRPSRGRRMIAGSMTTLCMSVCCNMSVYRLLYGGWLRSRRILAHRINHGTILHRIYGDTFCPRRTTDPRLRECNLCLSDVVVCASPKPSNETA